MIISHDGSTAPATLLGQDIFEHLDQQSRLGYVGWDGAMLGPFIDWERSEAVRRAFENAVDMEQARRLGLDLPEGLVIDADCPNGTSWRAWLGIPAV